MSYVCLFFLGGIVACVCMCVSVSACARVPVCPCVVCRVPCVVCCVLCAVCRVSCVVCRVSCAVCRVSCAVCRLPCAVCRVSCAVWDSPPRREPWRAAAWQHQYHGTGICTSATTTIANITFIIATTITLTIVICHSLSYPVAPCHSLSYPVAPCRSLSFPAVPSLLSGDTVPRTALGPPKCPRKAPPLQNWFFLSFHIAAILGNYYSRSRPSNLKKT